MAALDAAGAAASSAARTCCWYHGGDWHAVNAMALEVLERACAQCMEPDDMEEFAIAHAAAATRWQTEALASLFNIANAIQPASQTGYINGQHRAQAMLEAGVRAHRRPAPRRRDVAPCAARRPLAPPLVDVNSHAGRQPASARSLRPWDLAGPAGTPRHGAAATGAGAGAHTVDVVRPAPPARRP
ncbi:hypothetical protein [Streptomyces sp. AGS-58]|uniref:hypothetical protein n=1 Tax=unclassified Streptomyces TaxID=2593676 RepID=UPI0035A29B02